MQKRLHKSLSKFPNQKEKWEFPQARNNRFHVSQTHNIIDWCTTSLHHGPPCQTCQTFHQTSDYFSEKSLRAVVCSNIWLKILQVLILHILIQSFQISPRWMECWNWVYVWLTHHRSCWGFFFCKCFTTASFMERNSVNMHKKVNYMLLYWCFKKLIRNKRV